MQIFILPPHRIIIVSYDEIFQSFPIRIAIVKNTLSWVSISARSTALLRVILERFRNSCMDYKPDILLVDTHTKCDCRDDDVDLVSHPAELDVFSACVCHLGMVVVAFYLELREFGAELLAFLPGEAIDNA